MDLSAAYGAGYFAAPLGMADDPPPVPPAPPAPTGLVVPEQPDEILPVERMPFRSKRRGDRGDVYMMQIEIGTDDAHLLAIFIAVLILSLLFSSRK